MKYVVSYNSSDNSTVIQADLIVSSSARNYTVVGEPGITYHMAVSAVNAVGAGAISEYSIVTGETQMTKIDTITLFIQYHF